MTDIPDSQVVQTLPELMEGIMQDLYKILAFKGDHEDNPRAVLQLVETFAIDVVTHLSKKVETVRPGYSDRLLAFINEATKISTREEGVEKSTLTDYIENSVSGISSDDLTATVNFLANKIKDEINLRFEELPILSRNETILLCSLGIIVAKAFEEYDHRDLDRFINKFSGIIHTFVEENNSDQLHH